MAKSGISNVLDVSCVDPGHGKVERGRSQQARDWWRRQDQAQFLLAALRRRDGAAETDKEWQLSRAAA